jgi:hypothetical protein
LKPQNTIQTILEALASQKQRGETSLTVSIEPDLIQDVMNALKDYRKLFAPVISGVTDTAPIYAAYEQMRQADEAKPSLLLLVECQTVQEFREALNTIPIRKSSEWRFCPDADDTTVLEEMDRELGLARQKRDDSRDRGGSRG